MVVAKTSFSEKCDSDGIQCISCTDYQRCNAGVPEGIVISCKGGKSCADDQLRQCQKKLSCFALTECTQSGIFPDQRDDAHFFVCLGDASSGFLKYEFTCPDGNFFDVTAQACVPKAATAETSDETTITTTESPPTTTESPPTTTESPPTTTESPPTTTESPPTTTESPPTTTESPPTTTESPPFVCTQPGTFPNLDNCKMYYRCSSTLKAFFYICPGSSYFNENILKCSLIITPSCQEQISKNSTSTLPPVANIITTTLKTTTKGSLVTSTTTSAPKTTTISTSAPKPTTTTPATTAPPTPNPCQTGGSFPHPADCKTYYRCSVSGKAFLYTCPGKTYFNEFTKRCSLTMTARCKALVQG